MSFSSSPYICVYAAVLLHAARSIILRCRTFWRRRIANCWVVLRHRTHGSCLLSANAVDRDRLVFRGAELGFVHGTSQAQAHAPNPAHPCRESAHGQVRRHSATFVAGVDQPKTRRCVPRPTQTGTPLKYMFRLYSRLCTAVCTGGLSWDGTDEKRRSMTLFVMRYFRKPR